MRPVFERAGRMAPLLLGLDWGATSLGWPSRWPASLASAASICLGAQVPVAIYWGPDLSLVYNEAWSEIPGERHPAALGRPGREVWPDIWHLVGPDFEQAMGGVGVWHQDRPLPMQRSGFLEETYFHYNLSPILGEGGEIAGVFNTGIETTDRVLAERRNAMLLHLTTATSRAMTRVDALHAAAEACREFPADVPFALLYEVGDDRMPRFVAASGIGDDLADPDRWHVSEALATREPVLVDCAGVTIDLPLDVWPEAPTVAATVPIGIGRRRRTRQDLGAIVLGVPEGRVVDDATRTFHLRVAESLGFALVEADDVEARRRVHEAEHRIAATLQRSLIPELPELDGIDLDAEYLPGSGEVDVGGDWYDALMLPDGRIALVMGDVMGKGVRAAAEMGQLRNAVRAYLLEGYSPADVLRRLNRLAHAQAGRRFATVLCAFVDPARGLVEWCRAGHLPALVRRADGSVDRLDVGGSLPIGVSADADFADGVSTLTPGDALVLYTDGLVEVPGEDIDVGLDRLAGLVASTAPEDLLEHLVGELRDADRRDDVAVLVARP